MRKYTRDIDWDDFKSYFGGVFTLMFYFTFISAMFAFSYTDDESTGLNQEISLYAALQGRNVSDDQAIETARIFNEMYAGRFNNYSLLASQREDIGKHNSIFWAVANWDEVVVYLEDPSKKLPENHLWGNMFKWYFPMIFVLVNVLFSLSYFIKNLKDDFWKYPWTKEWAIPAVIIVLPYIILTQPFVLVYIIIREPAEYINKYLESCQVGYKKESQKKAELRRADGQHKYVKSKDDILDLKKDYGVMIKERQKNVDRSRKNFFDLCNKILQNDIEEIKSQIENSRSSIVLYGGRIEGFQKDILRSKQKIEEKRVVLASSSNLDLEEMFNKILNLPIVEAIEVSSYGNISIFTGTIFINYKNRISRIGNLEIIIDPMNYDVRIRNHTSTSTFGRNHPYGDLYSDDFCFGDFKRDIDKALMSGDFFSATIVILQALQTGKGGGRDYGGLSFWEEVSHKEH